MKLFYSYSSVDESLRKELEAHLALLKREGLLELWSFRDIDAGADWQSEISARLESADIVLLLISPNFLTSMYCWDIEMKRAIERAQEQKTILIPVIVRPCDWASAPFAAFQCLPEGARPITQWRPRDRGWASVASGIRKRVTAMRSPHHTALAPALVTPPGSSINSQVTQYALQVSSSIANRRAEIESAKVAMATEWERLYVELLRLVVDAKAVAPDLLLEVVSHDKSARIATHTVKLSVSWRDSKPILTTRCSLREQDQPSNSGILMTSMATVAWLIHLFSRSVGTAAPALTPDWELTLNNNGQWSWQSTLPEQLDPLSSTDLAGVLMRQLLDFHQDVVTRRLS